MRYLLLIYGDQTSFEELSESEREATYQRYRDLAEAMQGRGVLRDGAELQGPATATTVRVRSGQTQLVDGPFTETKESLAGYFLVECEDVDEAVEWAARIPGAERGAIEVRPLTPSA